jgi:CRISPR-associated protein Cmr3
MYNWYSFKPNDTLFFRGAEPMVKGEDHSSNFIFPPPTHTIAGAIRTYFYNLDKKNNDNKYSSIIKIGEEYGGFNLIGPFFKVNESIYIPAPYSWFIEKNSKEKNKDKFGRIDGKFQVIKSYHLKTPLIKNSSGILYWAKGEDELESTGSFWMNLEDLYTDKSVVELKETACFYSSEIRTGIALNKDHTVRKSHIYSFNHCRLKNDVSLLFGIDIDELGDSGILTLGAEQRFGKYKKENLKINLDRDGDLFMSLSLMPVSPQTNSSVISTGKIHYIGGWDLHKGFHKPMKGYFPAGTVFSENFNNCIRIS